MMNAIARLLVAAAALSTLLLAASSSVAADAPEVDTDGASASLKRAGVHFDLEVDPTAYVFKGYSAHAGLGWKRLRLDLGVYGMQVPEFFHGNKGFDAFYDGYGSKLQWFPFAEQQKGFIGIDGGVTRQHVELKSTGEKAQENVFGMGVNFGWRFALPWDLYATVWGGAGYNFAAPEIRIDGQTFHSSHLTQFAAVHLGYQLL